MYEHSRDKHRFQAFYQENASQNADEYVSDMKEIFGNKYSMIKIIFERTEVWR